MTKAAINTCLLSARTENFILRPNDRAHHAVLDSGGWARDGWLGGAHFPGQETGIFPVLLITFHLPPYPCLSCLWVWIHFHELTMMRCFKMFKNKEESTSIMTIGGEPWERGRELGDGLPKRYLWPLVSQEQEHWVPNGPESWIRIQALLLADNMALNLTFCASVCSTVKAG